MQNRPSAGTRLRSALTSLPCRIALGVLIPAALLGLALFFRSGGVNAPCPVYALTGLYCPGWGTGRATFALMRLDVAAAFGYNPLYVCLLPVFGYFVLGADLRYIFGRQILPWPKGVSTPVVWVVLAVVAIFTLLRTIPFPPFTLLAP